MRTKIQLLRPDVINKIAAGEVVENAASVVKELMENALDAGAAEVIVEVQGGGRQLIRITDDGCGMSPEDAVLSLERHATSKIQDLDDLSALQTMGFRGEAIASIASVSKFTLITRPEDVPVDQGTLITVEGGKLIQQLTAARSRGTTIEVKSLFYNVPVRKKFLKSPAHDNSEIFKVVSTMALGHPEIKFQLIRDGKSLLQTQKVQASFHDQLKNRIGSILSGEFLDSCLPVDWEEEGMRLRGYVGNPSYTRHNRLGQYLFINRRAVLSPLISRAVREGFGTTIPHQRYPVFVLHLDMPHFDVDVNVHPQKKEVRLRDEEGIASMVRSAVSRSLQRKESPKVIPPRSYVSPNFFSSVPPPPSVVKEEVAAYRVPELEVKHPEFDFPKPAGPQVLATIPGYILAESEEGLMIIDQKRAHHHILFNKMKSQEGAPGVQSLSLPIQIELTQVEADAMRAFLPLFDSLGFEIREFGKTRFMVDAIPQSFSNNDPEIMIKNIMEDLREYPVVQEYESLRDRQLARITLRGAISSSVRLARAEAEELACKLDSEHCPQGKPIWTLLSKEKIEELLGE